MLLDKLLGAVNVLDISGEHLPKDKISDDEIKHHGDETPDHPVEECDLWSLRRKLPDKSDHDDVRGSADRGEHTSDGAGVCGHQHQAGGIFIASQVNLLAIGGHHLTDSLKQAEGDGEHHGGGGGVADPPGTQHARETDGQEYPSG